MRRAGQEARRAAGALLAFAALLLCSVALWYGVYALLRLAVRTWGSR